MQEESTCKYYLQVQNEGERDVQRKTKYYNLEMIIAIGYRVRSHRGTQFRKWATGRINQYLVKGFAMDDNRLKDMRHFEQDYFDELLERIRDIRASEKCFYQKIIDIYATSVDYDPHAQLTQDFFATVQNKLHFAIHGHTAAELIANRATAEQDNMGITSWKGDKVRQQDVTVAKNYLTEDELKSLNRIVTMYLDYAEDQAERKQPMHMKDWMEKLKAFLQFNDREILEDSGKVSQAVAKEVALEEYERFNQQRVEQQTNDDFEAFLESRNLKK